MDKRLFSQVVEIALIDESTHPPQELTALAGSGVIAIGHADSIDVSDCLSVEVQTPIRRTGANSPPPAARIAATFWIILAPEDGVELGDLRTFTWHLMRDVERDLGRQIFSALGA